MGILIRVLLIALAVGLVIFALRRLVSPAAPAPTEQSPKNMVRCAQCGLHLPQGEAIGYQGRHYCCEEHRAQHTKS